jgi:hypothetical protein
MKHKRAKSVCFPEEPEDFQSNKLFDIRKRWSVSWSPHMALASIRIIWGVTFFPRTRSRRLIKRLRTATFPSIIIDFFISYMYYIYRINWIDRVTSTTSNPRERYSIITTINKTNKNKTQNLNFKIFLNKAPAVLCRCSLHAYLPLCSFFLFSFF